jgi:hypothetical protein
MMKRSCKLIAGCLLALLAASNCGFAQTADTKLYLLHDEARHQWCSYTSEGAWEKERDSIGTGEVGALEYSGGDLAEIDATYSDETGDWIVYDRYFVEPSGKIARLERKSNILPGDRSVEEVFVIASGKAQRQSIETRSLVTGEPKTSPDEETWLPKIQIVTRVQRFPFRALVRLKYSPGSSKEKSCISEPRR